MMIGARRGVEGALTASLILSLLLGCVANDDGVKPNDDTGETGDPAAGELPGTTLKGSTERETSPSTADLGALGAANATFALDLLRTTHGLAAGNQVTSPWSLQLVMAQVYAGAAGDAKTAIGDTFGWTLAEPALHEAFDAADLAVLAHNDEAGDPPLSITSTNQIFVTTGYEIGAAWLDTLSSYYGTGVQEMDFDADPSGVSDAINAWISARTGGHIEDLITAPMVSESRLLLVNAIYFKASWAVPFTESSTEDAPFTLVDGTEVEVPTMIGSITASGATAEGFMVVDIPYSDDGLTMTLVVPDAGRFEEIAGSLSWDTLSTAIAAENGCDQCTIQLPKFKIEGKPPIQSALKALGMTDAFGGAYPGISDSLTLTGVDQAGFVEVNEKGTEAAAATVAEFDDSSTESPFEGATIDRPFLWLVRETDTAAVLFAGVVMDPR